MPDPSPEYYQIQTELSSVTRGLPQVCRWKNMTHQDSRGRTTILSIHTQHPFRMLAVSNAGGGQKRLGKVWGATETEVNVLGPLN